MQGGQRSGGGKAVLLPHALALYQQQITMAHGESSQEVKQQQQQQQQLAGQPGKQQPYGTQADREREALLSSSPRIRPRSPSTSDKDGMHRSIVTGELPLYCLRTYSGDKSAKSTVASLRPISLAVRVINSPSPLTVLFSPNSIIFAS